MSDWSTRYQFEYYKYSLDLQAEKLQGAANDKYLQVAPFTWVPIPDDQPEAVEAAVELHKMGYRFLVDFGWDNAIQKLSEAKIQKGGKRKRWKR